MPALTDPTIFAIETAGARCLLALAYAGSTEVTVGPVGETHLEHVMPLVETLFKRAGVAPSACDAFAFASGPGSFTGLRVACTIVQGLALGCGRPIIAVGHLGALLRAATALSVGGGRRALVACDARMAQAYWAVYEAPDAGADPRTWQPLVAPSVSAVAQLAALVAYWRPDFCAGDGAWLRTVLGASAPPIKDAAIDATVLVQLAREQWARGQVLAAEMAIPEYVRDRVAMTVAERQQAVLDRTT